MSLSVVMLNWKRPTNVRRILDGLWQSPLVSEVIVWDNNPTTLSLDGKTKFIMSSEDMGLFTRFAAMSLAKNDAVLIQDDDLYLPHETIAALYGSWQAGRYCIHGIFGRHLAPGPGYSYHRSPSGPCPIVLTRAMICSREYAAWFFAALGRFRHLFDGSVPYGNGEDILLSYVAMAEYGQLNAAYDLPVKELPSNDAICKRAGHNAHRTRIVQACEMWLETVQPAMDSERRYRKQ